MTRVAILVRLPVKDYDGLRESLACPIIPIRAPFSIERFKFFNTGSSVCGQAAVTFFSSIAFDSSSADFSFDFESLLTSFDSI